MAPKKKTTALMPPPEVFEVVTDRRPFWDGRPLGRGHIISNPEKAPAAIEAMLGRGWIRRAENGKTED